MTNPQCIHIPDGSVVISGEVFDHFCGFARLQEGYGETITQLRGNLTLAEDGLASAMQEIGQAKRKTASDEAALGAMAVWLEENQPDVFRRGLWEAISAARKGPFQLDAPSLDLSTDPVQDPANAHVIAVLRASPRPVEPIPNRTGDWLSCYGCQHDVPIKGGKHVQANGATYVCHNLPAVKSPAEPSELQLLFNKGIGVQRGNGFSFAFPNEEDANQAFHYICDLGTLQTSQLPKSEASLRTPQGEPALTQTDGLPGTREPVSQQPYGNAGESPALSVKSLSSPPLQVEIRAATSRGCSSTEDAGRPGPSLYTCDECGAPLRCGPTQWEYDCGHGPAQRT